MEKLSYLPPLSVLQDSERETFIQFDGIYCPNEDLFYNVVPEIRDNSRRELDRTLKMVRVAKLQVHLKISESLGRRFGGINFCLFFGHSLDNGEIIRYPTDEYDIVQRTPIPLRNLEANSDQWLNVQLLPDVKLFGRVERSDLKYHGFIKRRNL